VIIGTSSDVVTSAATIGPDTATAVTSGLIILAALAYDGTSRSVLILLAAVAVGGLTKLTVFTGVGVAMLILLGRALLGRPRKRGRELLSVAGVATAVFAVFAGLSLAWYLRPVPDAAAPAGVASGPPAADAAVPWADIPAQLFFNFLAPNAGNYNASFLEGLFNTRLEQLMVGLMLFSVLVAALAFRRNLMVCALGLGVGLMVVVGPVILTLLNDYAYNVFYALPPRYGYGLLAGLAAVMAWTFREVAAARALVVVAAVSFVSVFV
jgi:hypothetical protein